MRIKLTRNTIVNGKPVQVGDVVDAEDRDARYLIAIGKAVETDSEAAVEAPTEKPLSKMNKDELIAKATELEVQFDPESTKAKILEAIEAAK